MEFVKIVWCVAVIAQTCAAPYGDESGVIRNGRENDGSYGIQLNGGSERAPLRPAVHPGGTNMFLMPRPLSRGNRVVVTGTFSNTDRFTLNLLTGERPDYENIACQVEINFPSSTNNNDGVILRTIENGWKEVINGSYQNNTASGMISGSTFKFEFIIRDDRTLEMNVNDSLLDEFDIKHDVSTITFLEVIGDVKITALNFEFS